LLILFLPCKGTAKRAIAGATVHTAQVRFTPGFLQFVAQAWRAGGQRGTVQTRTCQHPSFKGAAMLIQILQHTPTWVFFLFAALLWLGLSQTLTRTVRLRRIALQAFGLTAFSLYSTVSAFQGFPPALLVWLAGAGAMFALVMSRPVPRGTRYDDWQQRFTLPGSMLPLALIMGLFFIKYAVGAVTSLQPALAVDPVFALSCSAVYGAFSGVFAARAARLWRWALQQGNAGAPTILGTAN
jgi:hypothetical protein